MIRTIQGTANGRGRRIGIVVSRFNDFVTHKLLNACRKELLRLGVKEKDITICRVSGSLELPVTALALARKKNIDAVICLGAVIRGDTFHFELVCYGASYGIAQASLMSGKPVIFGVLSTDTVRQAEQRSRDKGENKGRDAARAAVEMIDVLEKLK